MTVPTAAPGLIPAITGIGALAAHGGDTAAVFAGAVEGRCSLGPITRFDASGYPVRIAGEVPDFHAEDHLARRLVVQTDLWTHFCFAATNQALADSTLRLEAYDPWEVSIVTAASSGGNAFGQREIQNLWATGSRAVSAYQSIAWFYAACTGQLSIAHGAKGANSVVSTEGAGGLDALGEARRALRHGSRVALAGGTEAPLCPFALACQLTSGEMSLGGEAVTSYRPFVAPGGWVPGEGGAMVVLEDPLDARRRGVPVYAHLTGYAATHDGTGAGDGGLGLARAMRAAVIDAGLQPGDIDMVMADACGVADGDAAEVSAIAAVFGEGGVPVTAPKAGFGRCHAGAGALDVALAALAIRHGVIPPTPGIDGFDGGRCDLVGPQARPAHLRHALVAGRGRGGFNAAVVLSAP